MTVDSPDRCRCYQTERVNTTDPDVADEIVATVRRFVERDVLPVASDL